jgi:hypothetical protein
MRDLAHLLNNHHTVEYLLASTLAPVKSAVPECNDPRRIGDVATG